MWPFKGKDIVMIERINGRKVNRKLRVGDTVMLDVSDGTAAEMELTEESKKRRTNRH